MKPRKTTYLLHRWIGLVISLQLLAWSTGGLVFSILDIRGVRGETEARDERYLPLAGAALEALPDGLRGAVSCDHPDAVAGVALVDRGLGPFWEVRDRDGRLLDRFALDGTAAGPISPRQAESIALRDFLPGAAVLRTDLVESDPPVEYRGKPLPAYRVLLDHAGRPHIYVDARTGEITARRNRKWRVFDFFWMLHTMDYTGRDNFNHPLLTAASVAAMLAAGSGLVLWGWRVAPRKRPKTAAR